MLELLGGAFGFPIFVTALILVVVAGMLVIANGFGREKERDNFIGRSLMFGLLGIVGIWVAFFFFSGMACLKEDHAARLNYRIPYGDYETVCDTSEHCTMIYKR